MDDLLNKLGNLAQNTVDKGVKIKDIAKLQLEVESENSLIEAYKQIIGEYVASHRLLSEDEIVCEQVSKILESQEKIAEYKRKIKVLKSGLK